MNLLQLIAMLKLRALWARSKLPNLSEPALASEPIGALALAFALALAPPAVEADTVNISYLEGTQPVAPDAITTLGAELFGDQVNLFNGALEFLQTDTQLPGNSALPVAVTRKYTVGRSRDVRGQFGDWDLETPRIGGSFAVGWVTSSQGLNRCTGFSLPPQVSSSGGGGGGPISSQKLAPQSTTKAAPANAKGQEPGATQAITNVGFLASDYWQGTVIHVPGLGSEEVLKRDPAYLRMPADGGVYPLVTRSNWQIDCLPSIQNAAGEGFVAVTPDGVRYRFDWMATRLQTGVKKSGAAIGRSDHFLMATEVKDRFGNWVRYGYDPANPLLLRSITSSDGRSITITNVGGRAISVYDGTRTFNYSYDSLGNLTSVLLPDGSRWTFNLNGMTPLYLGDMGEGANCDRPGTLPPDDLDGTMTHPSGAKGTFRTRYVYLGRTYVDRFCKFAPNSNTFTIGAVYPQLFGSQALVSKSITGPGMADMNWAFQYGANYGWNPCTGCSDRRVVTVTKPGGGYTTYQFGNRWRVNEGQLLRVDEGWNGSAWLKTTQNRYRTADGQRFPDQFGSSLLRNGDFLATKNRPLDQRAITQQGATFNWEADTLPTGFDEWARPVKTRQVSSLRPTEVRELAIEFEDNLSKWVLGQLRRQVDLSSNREAERHEFDPVSAQKLASFKFGLPVNRFSYRADGTLQTLFDAGGWVATFENFQRGKPQIAVFPDGTRASRVVNNLGGVQSNTNEAGTTTSYTFDAMGRVSSVNYPTGDPVAYRPTTIDFAQVQAAEYGIAPGHWRQTVSTGSGIHIRYLDALWRVRLDVRYVGGVLLPPTFTETRYDADNRKSFSSYPTSNFSAVNSAAPGVAARYDELDRPVEERADSELGILTTTTTYLAGFQRQVTNARGLSTVYGFQAFDNPNEVQTTSVAMADGSWLSISRDLYGKPKTITRGGTFAGQPQQVTRSYVYDAYQRLCKTIEPETGATVQQYDAANNLEWRASGLGLPATNACDHMSVPPSRRVSFSYDLRNRLQQTTFGDGSPGITRTYTPDGLLATLSTDGGTLGYSYNNRRLLVGEALSMPHVLGPVSVGYGIDADGNARVQVFNDGTSIDYAHDGLGRPTQVGSWVWNVRYHPNGQVASYVRGNNIIHSTDLNLRGLPRLRQDPGVMQDEFRYDENGNVKGIVDLQTGASTRSMSYDALDRLKTAQGIWGAGVYDYDALDNLRSSVVGGRSLTHQFKDGTNRLTGLVGAQNLPIAYDANGNVIQRGSQSFVFDVGNRMKRAPGVANYAYDGHGRRFWVQYDDGSWKFQFYSQAGKLLLSRQSSQGETKHLYLGDKLVAELNSISGVSYVHTDVLGSPVAKTSSSGALLQRTRYEPYGGTADGTNPVGVGFTGHVNDGETGLVYMQQRYYDPLAGRFISVDPVTTYLSNGSFFNRYKYANNNPYRFIDPDGRAPAYHGMSLSGFGSGAGGWAGSSESAGGLDRAAAVAAAHAVIANRLSGVLGAAGDSVKSSALATLSTYVKLKNAIYNASSGEGANSADKPASIPDNWREESTKGDGGRQWVNPDNPGDRVRVMPGNPDSPNPGQREPYVRDVRNGNQWLDVTGNRIEGKTGRNSPDTHIPVKDYVFRP